MSIRVTQQTMYNGMVGKMQKRLGEYMESVEQGSSQKKVNRPSDDPAGTYRILTTRQDITSTNQYQENVDTAKGWLNLADDVLSRQVTTAITGLKTLAEQASTGTYTADQRRIMADQARQYFGQLLNLSNTEFEGKSLFGGHKYNNSAFEEGLAITTWDQDWDKMVKAGGARVDGASESTVTVQFLQDGTLAEGTKFRWSNDGVNWHEDGVVEKVGDDLLIRPKDSGVLVTIPTKDADGNALTMPNVKGMDKGAGAGANNGTLLYIRPAAYYQGDDNDQPVDIKVMGMAAANTPTVTATGSFGKNILVRIDGERDANGNMLPVDLTTSNQEFLWSYSTDGGANWVTAKGSTTGDKMRLPIPGGYMEFDPAGAGNKLDPGTQIMVHPARADLGYEILKDTYLDVNGVGKDIFGGYYEGKPAMENSNQNIFEVVGSFIGYLEGNNQEGCQKTLAALTEAEGKILASATSIGGMENRLEMAADVLSFQKLDQEERLSYIEDIDLTELLTKLTRQQLTYQTVLQSSSMIMQMNLAKFL